MIIHADSQIVVVNKPPGISVHDAPGVGASLLRELRERHQLDGLTPVHRLDKDASGVLVLARSTEIAAEFQRRWGEAEKFYLALCECAPEAETGTIDAPILENQSSKPERLERAVRYFKKMNPDVSLSPFPKPKMSGVHVAGRASQTDFRVIKRFQKGARSWSWLELRPRQGRMHQIRVHLDHAGYPLACDALYGNRTELSARDIDPAAPEAVLLTRMPLHAAKLRLPGDERMFEAPVPADIQRVLDVLSDA